MKRMLTGVLILFLILHLSMLVSATASTISPSVYSDILQQVDGVYKLKPVVNVDSQSEEVKTFWKEWKSAYSGGSDKHALISVEDGRRITYVTFYKYRLTVILTPSCTVRVRTLNSYSYSDLFFPDGAKTMTLYIAQNSTDYSKLDVYGGVSTISSGGKICVGGTTSGSVNDGVLVGLDVKDSKLSSVLKIVNVGGSLMIEDNLPDPKHTLSISYQYENGKEALPMYKGSFEQGANFSVPAPAISGYIPSIATVSGVMGDTDLTYTVTYKQIKHTLTIQYQYEDGAQAHEPYTAQLAEGEPFRVDVPVIDGYKPSINVFTGQMANTDLNYTVTYTKIKEPEPSSSSGESSGSSGGSSSGSGGDSSGGSSSGGGSSGDASNIDNPYIVWNPTLVSAGFKQMKQQAGKAFNAGIWVFLMITGIILVAKLVKDLAH